MMKKMNKKGFTLAELLIVVAIIGVLTAVAIPIFSSQLEKSREATDLANVRDVYAEIASAMLTDDLGTSTTDATKDASVFGGLTATCTTSTSASIVIKVDNFPIQQKVDGWQSSNPQCAGCSVTQPAALPDGDPKTMTLTFTFAIHGSNTDLTTVALTAA